MILTSIRNPLPYKPNHQINPLFTSTASYFNPTTPKYLQSMNFTTIRILHKITIIDIPENPNVTTLYQRISNSTDNLFFILYTPANTLARQWYLVQADIESTMHIQKNYLNENVYFCVFLANHNSDVRKSDEFSQWWPDWYEYMTCPDKG